MEQAAALFMQPMCWKLTGSNAMTNKTNLSSFKKNLKHGLDMALGALVRNRHLYPKPLLPPPSSNWTVKVFQTWLTAWEWLVFRPTQVYVLSHFRKEKKMRKWTMDFTVFNFALVSNEKKETMRDKLGKKSFAVREPRLWRNNWVDGNVFEYCINNDHLVKFYANF